MWLALSQEMAESLMKLPSSSSTKTELLFNNQSNLQRRTKAISSIFYFSLKPFTSSPKPFSCLSSTTATRGPVYAAATTSTAVFSSLPTAKPERYASTEKVPKWSWRAIKAFAMAELEARKLKYANTGTEALLMGVLIEGTSLASKYLWEKGITLFKVREETIKLLGKADMYYFPPEQPPLTKDAQRALDWAFDHKLKSGADGEVTTSDLLLGIWSEVESPGHKLLATLGFNDENAKELESLSSGPGFADG